MHRLIKCNIINAVLKWAKPQIRTVVYTILCSFCIYFSATIEKYTTSDHHSGGQNNDLELGDFESEVVFLARK